jgi:hypothetical protein
MYRGWLFANIGFGICNGANTGFGFCDSGRAQLNTAGSRKHDGVTFESAGRAGSPCNLTARGDICG